MPRIRIVSQNTAKQRVKFPKITWRFVACVLVVVAICCVFIFALPILPQKPQQSANASYQGVVNLWLVDSFEGGSGNKKSWFTWLSTQFEKQNEGLFFSVTQLTQEQFLQKLAQTEQGEKRVSTWQVDGVDLLPAISNKKSQMAKDALNFDILCFSRGVGSSVANMLCPLDVDNGAISKNFAESGKIKGTTYALPVYCGGYFLFARTSQQPQDILKNCLNTTFTRKIGKNTVKLQPLVCGFTDSNSPLSALACNDVSGSVTPDYTNTQYSAYEQFVSNKKAVTLLGTQRDLYRLTQKQSLGKIEQLTICPLLGYTDLVQYVGVNVDSDKVDICQKFISFMLQDVCQQKLSTIGLFSVTNEHIYTMEQYVDMQKSLKNATIPPLFDTKAQIDDLRKEAVSKLKGE